ncbi:hypothetical protein H257_12955 [Aphanomyces astaci]|uniref:Major facilitator superfamily (MFS) profile domain-containing protein n=1 Tax=Aphanomyces astaci TaxID=112090 RepID=W4FXW4_APHAT|nr:hypothetical protein H257_12955 [Aphanomyces astaci]ETV71811.1 hypothetical protein H257_12955 [Aphanomyces astaci]RQM24139.1 hypothetical protein B5M09_011061 [Aphanomyces astaci]|eukprot:XP_009838660.1 hypothetical protein H257_12955 [Aphanomyces astaci]
MASHDNKAADLEERVSYVHSVSTKDVDGYAEAKSPKDLEEGALTEGGALDLFSHEAFALFMQYGAIGVINSMIPALRYPIFNIYLNLEGYQTSSYRALMFVGWSFKVFFGMLSDCIPIYGYRRKSWILIGWTIAMICLIVLTFSPFGEPFCNREKTKYCATPLEKVPKSELQYFNLSAPDNGTLYILLSMFTAFGYLLSASASDAMVVEYAQREPVAIRGRTQTAIYTVRTLTGILAYLVTAFGLNGPNYAGSFSFTLSPNAPYGISLVPCVLVVLSTVFLLVEKKTEPSSFAQWWGTFWESLQSRVMWQICLFRFVSNVFSGISTTAGYPVATYWAGVEPLNDSLSSVIGRFLSSSILVVVGKWGLNWNWRWSIGAGTIGIIVIDGFVTFITIWDVVRNQWFFTGVALAEEIPGSIRFIVSTYVAVEIADKGNEGATYGLLSTVSNLAQPFASMIYKYINSYFKVRQNDVKSDTLEVRWDVTYVYLISYGCNVASLFWLVLLPPQKAEVQALKARGGKSKVAGLILVVTFVTCLTFAVSSNIMSIFPSTKCYRVAGGNGVLDPKTGKCPLK